MKFRLIKIAYKSPLIYTLQNLYSTNKPISKKIEERIINSNNYYFNLDVIKGNKSEFSFSYYCLDENNIPVAYFSHDYNPNTEKIYLSIAEVVEKYQRKGIATKAYEIIKNDINNTFNPKEYSAFFVSEAGNKFGEKMGFISTGQGLAFLKNINYNLKLCKNIAELNEKFNKNNNFELFIM